jgi:molecular chaperone DnaK
VVNDSEIDRMKKEAEMHAEEDNKRKELIEVRNNADSAVYTAEKTLRDLGDKIKDDVKKEVTDQVAKVRESMSSENVDTIRQETEKLGQAIQKIGASMYQQPGGDQIAGGPAGGGPTNNGGQGPQGGSGDGGEDVVDGEFKNV